MNVKHCKYTCLCCVFEFKYTIVQKKINQLENMQITIIPK